MKGRPFLFGAGGDDLLQPFGLGAACAWVAVFPSYAAQCAFPPGMIGSLPRVQILPHRQTKNAPLSTKTKVRFLNDVCLWQMMLATPMMTASPNDACLRAHRGKHRIIATKGSNIILSKAKNIISPQAMHHLKYIRLDLFAKV